MHVQLVVLWVCGSGGKMIIGKGNVLKRKKGNFTELRNLFCFPIFRQKRFDDLQIIWCSLGKRCACDWLFD